MFDILNETLQSHPFRVSRKFKMQGCYLPMICVKRIKSIFEDTMNSGARFGAPRYYASNSPHFLNTRAIARLIQFPLIKIQEKNFLILQGGP